MFFPNSFSKRSNNDNLQFSNSILLSIGSLTIDSCGSCCTTAGNCFSSPMRTNLAIAFSAPCLALNNPNTKGSKICDASSIIARSNFLRLKISILLINAVVVPQNIFVSTINVLRSLSLMLSRLAILSSNRYFLYSGLHPWLLPKRKKFRLFSTNLLQISSTALLVYAIKSMDTLGSVKCSFKTFNIP